MNRVQSNYSLRQPDRSVGYLQSVHKNSGGNME